MFKKILTGAFMFTLAFMVLSCSVDPTTNEPTTSLNTTEEPTTEALTETPTTQVTTETPTDEPTTEPVSAINKVIVHYYRFDDDYSPWSLWIWPHIPDSGDGKQYNLTQTDDYGVYLEIDYATSPIAGSTTIGVIVAQLPSWSKKDIGIDRFIDLSNVDEEGNVHVYLVQNTEEIYYDADEVDLGDRINFVQFTDESEIEFTSTTSVVESQVKILKNDVEITLSSFQMSGTAGVIMIDEVVDLNQRYHLEIDFGNGNIKKSLIRFDGFYDSETFDEAFYYDGELGAIYSPSQTIFRLWAPISESVTLNLYSKGHTASEIDYDGFEGVDNPYDSIAMTRIEKGVFEVTVEGDLDGVYYTFTVNNDGSRYEVMDPYAYSAGVNGKRGMVVDFSSTNPNGWIYGSRPNTMNSYTDAIVYELHVRDLTSHESWNGTEAYRGKFLGLTERGTTYSGVTTGLDHIIDLGVTHVQFVPIFDHGIIDETRLNDESYYGIHDGIFNWGYMPENFNVVEGSYSTDPYNGHVRIEELKTMVQTFHNNDIRVIMDVVYNHTGKSADSNFDLILPGYYFRMNSDGTFSNGSGTGNETASERSMVRKYMVDSLLFWTEEYNIDGFRFDLMKLHDLDTMNAIVEALHAIDPTIMIFGEPWTGGTSLLPDSESAYKNTLNQMPGVAIFNDNTRDAIKGTVWGATAPGFVQGYSNPNDNYDNRIIYAVVGGENRIPTQMVNYVTAHDNNTLYDKLMLSTDDLTIDQIERMQRQANGIILTSQGIAFLHSGVEIMRTKPCVLGGNTCDYQNLYDHNSYRSPDETNQIDWQWKVDYFETFEYYQTMIALRKAKDVFRLSTKAEVDNQITVLNDGQDGIVAFILRDPNDYWKTTYVIHNNGKEARTYNLHGDTTWNLVLGLEAAELKTITDDGNTYYTFDILNTYAGGTSIELQANDTLILYSTEIVE
ncbi:type I pullulanase [Hujiaoplasma nucleasis]|uniref:pullulanase n=1 Tax=Hujiaoplasma nucleasis TaxID=2725268 RepID=A0A7L6N5A5_9MOLU|nr:type I pullulanase [Hujiaoplasma nucleasis]QLY39684.1 type I pullulanase [Hujiaoplasma nucleasis]